MKTQNPKPQPHLMPPAAIGSETLPPMKTKLAILKLIVVLCAVFATTAVFGQVTYTWTNSGAGPLDLATTNNWNPNGVPLPNNGGGDTMQFDGQSSGPVAATSNTGAQTGSSAGGVGLVVHLTSNQANSVTFYTTVANSASTGIRIKTITVDPGAGSFILGNNSTTNALDTVWGGASGEAHTWDNESTNPVIVTPNFRMRYGGGGAHTQFFQGAGDFQITNNLITANGSPTIIAKGGTGKMIWTAGSDPFTAANSSIQGPVTLNGGALILRSGTLLSGVTGTQNIQNNDGSIPTLLEYDAPSQSGTIGLTILNSMNLQVNNGTLTLSAAGSSFTGTNFLSGGEVIVNAADNAVTGPLGAGSNPIFFTGGTLGYSANNTFDYSSRFDTSSVQAYSIDTAGQNVTFATGLSSSGGSMAKLGSGTLTLSGTSSYSGATTVSAGKLVFQGSKTGSGNISVANSAALGVVVTGTQVAPGTLALGTSSGATLEFNGITSTATAPLAAGTLTSAGTVTVNVNSGTFASGQSYPLFSWTSGSAPAVSLGVLNGAVGNLTTNGNTIKLNITGLAFVWTGLNNNSWDISTLNNWKQNGSAAVFANGGGALLDDSATANFALVLNSPVSPGSTIINSTTNAYSITSTGANLIGGSGSLSKSGNSTLTMSGGVNTYSGVTTISGGILSVSALANGGAASDIGSSGNSAANLVFNGGTLQYTGSGASIDRLFTVGTAGGTIDGSGAAALNLTNSGSVALSGTGARVLTLTGTSTDTNTFAGALGDNGGATELAKSGTDLWALTGTNSYSGITHIASGTLQVGIGGTNGTLGSGNVIDSGSLVFNRSDALTNSDVISDVGSVSISNGTVVLAANETYSGGTTIGTNSILQIGKGGATGSLGDHPIVDNGLFIYNSTTPTILAAFSSIISGPGNVIVHAGTLKAVGVSGNTYTGWTQIDPGATFQFVDGNQGALTSSVITNNGTLFFTAQEFSPGVRGYSNNIVGIGRVLKDNNNANSGWIVFGGTNSYTGGTFIAGGGIELGDGINSGAGTIVGNVVFTNTATANLLARTLVFNHPDSWTFANNISSVVTDSSAANSGAIEQDGPGTVTLTGNNSYPGSTIVSNGVIQVGNGGTTGSIGGGTVIINAGGLLFNRSDSLTVTNGFSGTSIVAQVGTGTLTLTGNVRLSDPVNNIIGSITVSNGTLVLNPNGNLMAGNLNVNGGTLIPGGTGVITSLIVSNNMNITGGTVSAQLNKSSSPSNSLFNVLGTVNATGGTLQVVNNGPTLAVGDKFTIFSQPVAGGASLTVTGGSATWINNLAVDGSISVATVVAGAPTLNFTKGANSLQFSWSGSFKLQAQTNSLSVGLKSNWGDYPGGGTSPVTVPTDSTSGAVFFRLISTP